MRPTDKIQLTPGKRVLYLTKDAALIRAQLAGELTLRADELNLPADLLDDINTDVMTPAWVCFSYKPEDIARDAYAGLIVDGERIFERDALTDNNFEMIVSGFRKGTGSSRETAVQAEKWGGIRIAVAESFAPIHARNNINHAQRAVELSEGMNPTCLHNLARCYFYMGDLDRALGLQRRAASLLPAADENNPGIIRQRLAEYEAAIAGR